MLALLSVWIGLAALVSAAACVFARRLFNDLWITFTLYAAIFSLTFAGMVLWSLRKEPAELAGVKAQRAQCYVGAGLSLAAVVIVYVLVGRAEVVPR